MSKAAAPETLIKAGTSAAAIEAAIKGAAAGSTIRLEAGDYTFEKKVQITRSDIKIVGAGVGETNIEVKTKGTGNATAFDVQGGKVVELTAKLTTSTTKGSTTELVLSNVDGISKGSIIQLQQANDRKWLDSLGNTHVKESADPLREMIAKVVDIKGNKVILESKTPYNFGVKETTISVISALKNIEIGGFSIKTDLGSAGKFDFTNLPKGQFNNSSTVEVTRATDVNLHDIEVKDNASHGFSFSSVYGISGDRLTTIGSHNKGGDGNGYAFFFKHAFNNTFTNLTDMDMRHSVLFGSWSAEHYNDIRVLYTNRDINFHGSPDDGNTIYVERSVLSYDSRYSHSGVSPGDPKKHPNATIDANDVKFAIFRGSAAQDTIYGASGGSDLAGGADRDRLVGGSGVDRLDGGVDNDILAGGGGADLFIFRRSYDTDTITDFSVSQDKLDLSNTGIVDKANLAIRQVGKSTVISLGGGDETVLNNVTASKLTSKNFVFSKALTKGVTIEMTGSERGATGTNKNDVIKIAPGYLDDKLHVVGSAGIDSLQVIKGSSLDLTGFGRLAGIEVIDMTMAPAVGTVKISKKMALQSDKGYLTVKVDGTGTKIATTDIKDVDLVRISGSGPVQLDKSGAYVSAASGTKLNVVGNTGNDYIKGGSSADKINGGGGNDIIVGGNGNDTLSGGGGSDRITGGLGADVLSGDSGADRFIFTSVKDSTVAASGRDTITNFYRSQGDLIDVSPIDANTKKAGSQAFSFIDKDVFSGKAGELRYEKSGAGTLVTGDVNGDKKADFSIFVDQLITFKASDFIL